MLIYKFHYFSGSVAELRQWLDGVRYAEMEVEMRT